jgi:hypothetical protein
MARRILVSCAIALSLSADASTATGGSLDGGMPRLDASVVETPAQRTFRREYVEQTLRRESEITKSHVWTPEMRKVSFNHWRRAYKALRIRDVAQDENDAATVGRVDAYITKINEHFFALLTELAAKAPLIPPPPTLISPTAGAQATVGTAVSFKMAPYKDAKNYYCSLWEPGGHLWSNWHPGEGEALGASSECTIPADDGRWSKFRSGKAEFHGRALLVAKAESGEEYKVWSEPVKLELNVNGVAGPPAAGSQPPPPAPKSSASAGGAR